VLAEPNFINTGLQAGEDDTNNRLPAPRFPPRKPWRRFSGLSERSPA